MKTNCYEKIQKNSNHTRTHHDKNSCDTKINIFFLKGLSSLTKMGQVRKCSNARIDVFSLEKPISM